MREDDSNFYLLTDHLGSVVGIADGSGSLISEQRYMPYGLSRLQPGIDETDFGYTGQRSLNAARLMDYNARWYSTSLSSWTQADTYDPSTSSQTNQWNRYAYADHNPLILTDPSGHYADEGCGIGGPHSCDIPKQDAGASDSQDSDADTPGGLQEEGQPVGPEVIVSYSSIQLYGILPYGPGFYYGIGKYLDVLQVLLDVYGNAVVYTWATSGGIAGIPGGPGTSIDAGAAGWAWGQVEAQPLLRVSDLLGWGSSLSNLVGDAKSGKSWGYFSIARAQDGRFQLQQSGRIAPSTANSFILTAVGSSNIGTLAEVSLALDTLGLIQDFFPQAQWPVTSNYEWYLHN